MEKTTIVVLIFGGILLILALIRLFYALYIMKNLKKIRQCVDSGYQSVSKGFHLPKIRLQREEQPIQQQYTQPYQTPIQPQSMPITQENNQEMPNFDEIARQFESEMPNAEQTPEQQMYQVNPVPPLQKTYIQPQNTITVQKPGKRPYTTTPEMVEYRKQLAAKMRAAKIAKRTQILPQEPQELSEVEQLKKRLKELGG